MTLLGNTVPTADTPNVTIDEDGEYTFGANIFNFQDGDSDDTLDHVQITVLPEHGTLTLNDANVTADQEVSSDDLSNLKYTPPDDVNGSPFTTFKFKVNDSYEDSAEYTFTFNVDPVNDVPTAGNSTVDVDEDTEYAFAVDNFGFTDIDSDENITQEVTQNAALAGIKITSLPGKGSLEFDGDVITDDDLPEEVTEANLNADKLTYTPLPEHDYGSPFTTFDFKVNDGAADSESAATMTINVAAVNDLPVVSDSSVRTNEDEQHTFGVDDFDFSDADQTDDVNEQGDSLSHLRITTLPGTGKGTLEFKGTTLTSEDVNENESKTVERSELDDRDLTYHPPLNANGDNFASFEFKAKDGIADSAEAATMTLNVTAVDDPPMAKDDTIEVDANPVNPVHVINVLENDEEVDGDTLSISALGTGDNAPANGTAERTSFGLTPAISYTPYNNDFIGADEFTYTISDGQSLSTATVYMTVVPTVSGPISQNYHENGTEATNGTDNVDVVVATYRATVPPTWSLAGDDSGVFTINANGELGFKILPDYESPTDKDGNNEYKITVQATVEVDNVEYTGTQDVTVTVTSVDEDVVWSVPQNTEFSFAENGTTAAATITVTDPEKDFDGSSYSGVDISWFTHGTYTETPDGGARELPITFKNLPDYEGPTDNGEDNVYEANLFVITGDLQGDYKSFTLSFTIRVTDVNDAPVAENDEPSTNEDTVVVISVLANDTDEDEDADGNQKDTLSVTAVGTADGMDTETETNPANGTVAITGDETTVTYTPDDDFNGTDTFTYVVSDGELTDIGTVTVTVNAVNDPPVAVDDTLTIDEGASAAEIDVITITNSDGDSDSDVDNDTLSVSEVGSADNGITAIKSGSTTTVTYTPDANFAGIDTFTYMVSDGSLTDTGMVTVKVTPMVRGENTVVSDNNGTISYAENRTDAVDTYTAGGNPSPGNPSPTWTLSGTDRDKFNIGSSSGVLSFKEPPDYEDPDGNTYQLTVEASADGVIGTLAVTVTVTDAAAGTDPPVATDDFATTEEDTAVDIKVLDNDTADDKDALSVTVGTGANGPSNGTAILKTGSTTEITYMPSTGFAGIDTFTYTVSDGQEPALTDTGKVTVGVMPTVRGKDTVVSDNNGTISYAENRTDAVDTYTAGGDSSPAWSLSGTNSNKFDIGLSSGVLSFNDPPDYEDVNTYNLTVEATITEGNNSVTGTLDVTVTVTDVNEAPAFDDDTATRSVDENATGDVGEAVGATDPDTSDLYSDLTYSLGGDTDKDAFDIDESTGQISVKTDTTLNYETTTRYSVTVSVRDSLDANGGTDTAIDATITVEITVTDLPAVTGSPESPSYAENGTVSVATYSTSETVTWSLAGDDRDDFSIGTDGALSFNSLHNDDENPSPDYENPTDGNGDNVYELTVVADDSGEEGRLGVTVTVTDASNLPVPTDDTLIVSEDESATVEVIDDDEIEDTGFTLSVSEVGDPSNGTAAITEGSTTKVTYTPNENFDGEDTFTYTVSNGVDPPEAKGTVTVTVESVNDPPKAVDDIATTNGEAEVVIDVLANDTDVDKDADGNPKDTLSVTAVGTAAYGTVVIAADGATVTYTPYNTFLDNESDTFTYTVSDGATTPLTAIGRVTVMLNAVPTALGNTVAVYEGMAYTFKVGDFGFEDDDENDELDHVKIISLPNEGTLSLNDTPIPSATPAQPQHVTATELGDGKLTYTPPDIEDGSVVQQNFGFTVNDVFNDSAAAYITIDVVLASSMSFGAAAYEVDEGGDEVTVQVILNQPASNVPITVTAGTAEARDYSVAVTDPDDDWNKDTETVTLTFDGNEANNTKTFTITAEQDADSDDETVTLGFGNLTATLTIIDAEGNVIRARFRRLNNEILSKHALTLADVTIAAVTSRQEAGPTCAGQATTGSLGGSSSLAEILTANVQTLMTGSLNLKQLLGTSSFRLRLTEDGSGAGPGCLTLWGQGDYRNLSSGDSQNLDWNGDLVTGQVGADALLRPDLRAGLAVSWSDGAFDYTDRTTGDPFGGDYSSRMVSVHPYLTWWSPMGLDLWATGGYGQGEIEINDEEDGSYSSDTTLRLASVGASGPLLSEAGLLPGGTTTLRLKAQASLAQMEVEGNGSLLQEQTIDAQRLRLALEGSHERPLASGGSLTPSFEVGLRHDGGDGATGTGLELGGGLRYIDPALGLTVEGRGRVLSSYDDTYKEWGASGLIRLDPGAAGQGLAFSLVPSYGQTASGVQRLWDQGLPQGASATQAPTGRLAAEVGYGLAAFAGQGLVTPYGAVMLGGGTQQYRVGSRLELGPALRLSLEGTRQVTTVGQADHGLRLQADWQF